MDSCKLSFKTKKIIHRLDNIVKIKDMWYLITYIRPMWKNFLALARCRLDLFSWKADQRYRCGPDYKTSRLDGLENANLGQT